MELFGSISAMPSAVESKTTEYIYEVMEDPVHKESYQTETLSTTESSNSNYTTLASVVEVSK